MAGQELTEKLETELRRQLGAEVSVSDLEPLAGGASCRIYSFCAEFPDRDAPRELVLRMDADGGSLEGDRTEEYALLRAAHRTGVTVPEPLLAGDAALGLGGSFFVMERAAGEAIARRLLRDDSYATTRAALPAELGRELAHIHRMDAADPSLAFLAERAPAGDDPRRFALEEIARYRQTLELAGEGRPYPLLELTARWLEQNAPPIDRPVVVHGDFRIGNVMFDEAGLTAVLDWELAHLGDPVEDLGWLCVWAWRFGARKPVGGLCERDELLEHYRRAGGATVDPGRLRYWELYGNWKWAIICVMQGARHDAGSRRDLELAAIGRRVAETEWEILALLDEIEASEKRDA